MESNEEIIKIKVRNTLALKNVNPNVLDWIRDREKRKPPFKGHYDTPHELINDISLIEDTDRRKNLIAFLKSKHTKNLIIAQAIAYFENQK